MEENEDCTSVRAILFNLAFWTRTIAGASMNAFSYELFINFRMSFHLRVKSTGVLTIKTFRKIMFDSR